MNNFTRRLLNGVVKGGFVSFAQGVLKEDEKEALDKATAIAKEQRYHDDVVMTVALAAVMSSKLKRGDLVSFRGSRQTIDEAFEFYERLLEKLSHFEEIVYAAQLVSSEQAYEIVYQPRIQLNLHIPDCQGCGTKLEIRYEQIWASDDRLDLELRCPKLGCGFGHSLYNCQQNTIRFTLT